jgi:hypothetical protein
MYWGSMKREGPLSQSMGFQFLRKEIKYFLLSQVRYQVVLYFQQDY